MAKALLPDLSRMRILTNISSLCPPTISALSLNKPLKLAKTGSKL
jgi:hypothetical protein